MTDKEKIRAEIVRSAKLRKDMMEAFRDSGNINAAANENVLYGFCLSLLSFIDSLQEEPVSEDLEEAAKNHAVERYRTTRDRELAEKCKWSFKAGAQWQKEQEYTCYEEAFEDGASWKKEEMMKGAIDAKVHIEAGNYPYIPQMELYDYDKDIPLAKKGDKVKIVVIKEEE